MNIERANIISDPDLLKRTDPDSMILPQAYNWLYEPAELIDITQEQIARLLAVIHPYTAGYLSYVEAQDRHELSGCFDDAEAVLDPLQKLKELYRFRNFSMQKQPVMEKYQFVTPGTQYASCVGWSEFFNPGNLPIDFWKLVIQ